MPPDQTSKPASTRPASLLLRTLTAAILGIGALFAIDTFLEKTERMESHLEAARFYANGQRMMEQGRSAEAVDQFRSAIAADRGNADRNNAGRGSVRHGDKTDGNHEYRSHDYELALAQALLAGGRLGDAESVLNELLQQDPVGAAANLAMARLLVKQGDMDDAASYYHRAIYGQWKDSGPEHQVQVRFELADLMSRQNSQEALLAELLPLQDQAPADPATRKRLGTLFLAAGSPALAADIFRGVLRRQPQDAEADAGLGEAEFARGNYRAAQQDFAAALRVEPANQDAQRRLELSDRVLELEPTRRGLSLEEQYRRGRKLVDLVLDDVAQCLGAPVPEPAQSLIDTVQNALKKPVTAVQRGEALEDDLDWADRLWQLRQMDCKQPLSAAEEPLNLVLARLAQ